MRTLQKTSGLDIKARKKIIPRKFINRFLLLLVSLGYTLLFVEILLAKAFPQKTFSSVYQKANKCFRPSSVTEFELKPNCKIPLTDFDTQQTFTTTTNSLGYRGHEFKIDKPEGNKRILVEGDSFMLGFGVRDDQVFTNVLEDQLRLSKSDYRNAEVINAGYAGGFGPDGYFMHLKNRGLALHPDLVIFSIFIFNDLTDMDGNTWIGLGPYGEPEKIQPHKVQVDPEGYLTTRDIPTIYKIPYLRESQLAILVSNGIEKLIEKQKYIRDRIKFMLFPPQIPTGDTTDDNVSGFSMSACIYRSMCHRQTLHLFSDLFSILEASNTLITKQFSDSKKHFLVLLIPADFQIYPEALEKYKGDAGIPTDAATMSDPQPQQRIKNWLEKTGIAYIDLLPEMRKNNRDTLYFLSDGHWNGHGHQVAALTVAQSMVGDLLLANPTVD